MSQQGIMNVIERLGSDRVFRARLSKEGEAALVGFDLTPSERKAVATGDRSALEALGVDLRLTKNCVICQL